jgi:outer membrane protein assembly factor BamB
MNDLHVTRRKLIGTASAAGVAVVGMGLAIEPAVVRAQDAAATPEALATPVPAELATDTNWAYENLDLAATRNAKGTTIAAGTVGQLGEAWTFPITTSGGFGALTANPIVAGDTVFIQDAAANVYALNKATGEQLWANTYSETVPSGGPNGLAVANGVVYTTLGGTANVIALAADTGKELWRTNIQGPLLEGITTAPLVYDNAVYVSTIPGESNGFYEGGQRGVIHALDATNGKVLWYFDTTTDNLWGNPRVNSGGGFWHPPSVDEEGKLYIGIGNPAPWPGTTDWPNGTSRPGDNLYTNCILKMDPATGTLEWYYQVVPHDLFDRDNQLTPVLADLADGRKVVFISGKHGYVVCLERHSGDVLWRIPVGKHENDDVTEIPAGQSIEVYPTAQVETPMAYADGTLFLALWGFGGYMTGSGPDPNHPFDLSAPTGSLVAVKSDGTIAWNVDLPTGILGGATVTNDVVFTGGLDGVIRGHSTADGSEVFTYQVTAGINTSPAVSGDFMYWAAGAPLVPSSDTANPAPKSTAQVVAIKIGGKVQTPSGAATPTS